MAYELISEKLLTFKSGRRKISTDNSNKINLLKNQIIEIKAEQARRNDNGGAADKTA